MESAAVSSPAAFAAFTVKLKVPSVVGVPVSVPSVARVRPSGNEPLASVQVGAVPVAARASLYGTPTMPSGNEAVVIAGATGAAVMSMENAFVSLPTEFSALTVKLNMFITVGVPEIVSPDRERPFGNAPLSMLHVIGAVPEATSVWLYVVPSTPSGRDALLITGAVGPLPLGVLPTCPLVVPVGLPLVVGCPVVGWLFPPPLDSPLVGLLHAANKRAIASINADKTAKLLSNLLFLSIFMPPLKVKDKN